MNIIISGDNNVVFIEGRDLVISRRRPSIDQYIEIAQSDAKKAVNAVRRDNPNNISQRLAAWALAQNALNRGYESLAMEILRAHRLRAVVRDGRLINSDYLSNTTQPQDGAE